MGKEVEMHYCDIKSDSKPFGAAITDCYEDEDGMLWVENGEYTSRVNYCPLCGFKAPNNF